MTAGLHAPLLPGSVDQTHYCRTVLWDAFTGTCATGAESVILFLWNVRVIRFVSADASETMVEFGEVSDEAFEAVEVPLTWTCAEALVS